jgi:hypothetical protein
MIEYLGSRNGQALFSNGILSAVVDTNLNMVVEFGALSNLQNHDWSLDVAVLDSTVELAAVALSDIEQSLTASAGRMYTIPDGVKSEAVKALKWRKEEKRGGTPVGLNTARLLSKGGQIGLKKVRHIAKYFPRHEVDKKGKGWEPGEDNFPSNGRIAWALWGGDAAWRWASAIVERENKKSLTAGGYDDYMESPVDYDSDVNAFKAANDLDANFGPEFLIRVRLDGSGIDRLYKVEIDGQVYVWDDCSWDDLGHVDGDIYTYDVSLDDPYDTCEKTHVMIDPSSAIIVSALMQERPFDSVQIDDIDSEEAQMMAYGLSDIDYDMVDLVLTAATSAPSNTDGTYTPEERSALAGNQPRDMTGRFAAAGNRTVVGGDLERGSGVITKVDSKTGKVDVKLDSGNTISVDAKMTQTESSAQQAGMAAKPFAPAAGPKKPIKPVDTSGILGSPKKVSNTEPKATLKEGKYSTSALTKDGIDQFFSDWNDGVIKARTKYSLAESTLKDEQASIDEQKAREGEQRTADLPAGSVESRQSSLDRKKAQVQKMKSEDTVKGLTSAATPEVEQTPTNTDVAPKYLAIVSPDDPAAVMDVVAVVPKTTTTVEPVTYKRKDGQWIFDEQTLKDLKSATPPPVVHLDTKELINDILTQVDGITNVDSDNTKPNAVAASLYTHFLNFWGSNYASLVAAGGLDRNRGNAEELRQYWTRGKGAAKIRWGTPGDWTRCVRQLSKYMGPRAKGYCQLRHKEVTGVYTGSRFNPGNDNKRNFGSMFQDDTAMVASVIDAAYRRAQVSELKERVGLVAGAMHMPGATFTIPLLLPEQVETGDGRKFSANSVVFRDLPLPLLWQIKTGEGHSGSVVVGRIDHMERIGNGIGNAHGVFDTGPFGREAERLVRNGFIRGVSADLDQFEADKDKKAENSEKDNDLSKEDITVNHARVMAATIVAKPAFQECTISIEENYPGNQENEMIPADGIYEESLDSFGEIQAITASGFLESAIPMTPPEDWFHDPRLTKPTPITIEPNGRIYGHIAAWNVNHIGMPRSTRPPRSKSKYSYFHTGVCRTDTGKDIPVGQLTLAGGHAPLQADAVSAAKHYDDTASAIADVHAGEDAYGIWVSGSVRPDATEMQIRALRASAPSGDWRPVNGSLELVAVCQVNVPGFPIARAMVASGKVMALVAAGASYFAIMKSEHVISLVDKAARLSDLSSSAPDLKARALAAKASITSVDDLRNRALTAAALSELAGIDEEERKELARKGLALPDGSYPIRNVADLKNAIQAYGRSKNPADAKKHIISRAKDLNRYYDLIPEEWRSKRYRAFSSEEMDTMRSRIAELALVAAGEAPVDPSAEDIKLLEESKIAADEQTQEEVQRAEDIAAGKTTVEEQYDEDGRMKYTPETQPRDARGKYRKVLARLRQDLGVAGLQKALKRVENAENLEFAGNYAASSAASADLLGMIDRLDSNALNAEALENVKGTARELGRVISNLPLPFGVEADKLRFSDLPSGLKDLMDNMIDRVEQKIGKEDADIATASLKSFKSGSDVYSQAEIQSEMSKLLRLLT